jgi:cytochrome c peroxidase
VRLLLLITALAGTVVANLFPFPNPTGIARTWSTQGAIGLDQPFFQSLGTNGRACVSCHVPTDGWSIVPAHVQARFDATGGEDALFRPNDGSVSPLADVGTLAARREAYRLLLERGLIRIGLAVPDGAQFALTAVDDPHGYASAAELSLFRRPLPSTNLAFLTTVMWDGRETTSGQTIHFDLARQANGATRGHAQAEQDLTPGQQAAIVAFETSLYTAQAWDRHAADLHGAGADGGPRALGEQPFAVGVTGPFTLFDAWTSVRGARWPARRAMARGQALFNTRAFVNGAFVATCGACHNTPNAGSHAGGAFFDLGLAAAERRAPDVPLYTLQCLATGAVVQTTDPGRALVTGRCADIGRFKVPTLRGLAARAPYFHDGSAATLADVVEFYDTRFSIGLTGEEKADLVAFLRGL